MMQKMFAVFLALTLLLSGCAAEQAPVGQAPSPDALAVEAAYHDMLSATEHLSMSNNGYTFQGYPLSDSSVTRIGDTLVVDQGAMYEEIAGGLALYCDFGLTQVLDEAFFSVLTGSEAEPENWAELAKELYTFILPDGTERDIIAKLETLDGVTGTFDYDANTYDFEIADLGEAASALHISPEMLGYILAKLNAYTDNITFSGNGVSLRIM